MVSDKLWPCYSGYIKTELALILLVCGHASNKQRNEETVILLLLRPRLMVQIQQRLYVIPPPVGHGDSSSRVPSPSV